MRTLILVTILAATPALADTAQTVKFCETRLSGVKFEAHDALRFLKRIQVELGGADAGFPVERYVRIGAGRAVGPIVAALQTLGGGADSLPVDLNFHAPFIPGSLAERQLHHLFATYLPLQEMEAKTLALFVYDEDPRAAIALVKMVESFLDSRHLQNKGVRIEFITRQDRVDVIEAEFANTLTTGHYRVRPLALANQLRLWLHDALKAGEADYSQYKILDVQKQIPRDLIERTKERKHFGELKEKLSAYR